jgi:hypothetical protein
MKMPVHAVTSEHGLVADITTTHSLVQTSTLTIPYFQSRTRARTRARAKTKDDADDDEDEDEWSMPLRGTQEDENEPGRANPSAEGRGVEVGS